MYPSFRENWDRIEKFLEAPIFREVLNEDTKRAKKYDVNEYLTKIDMGILGFLWCQGT